MTRLHKKKLKRISLYLFGTCLVLLLLVSFRFSHVITRVVLIKNKVEIRNDVPVLRLTDQYAVSAEGKVFPYDQALSLPEAIFIDKSQIEPGKYLPQEQLKNCLTFIDGLKLINFLFEQAVWDPKGNLIVQSKPTIIFSLENDAALQLASLQLILEKAKIGKGQIDLIDLRFDKPVLRYAQRK